MSNCYSLTRKGEKEPTALVKIDEELCKHFNVKCDEKRWYVNWHNIIGFALAMGKSFQEIIKDLENDIANEEDAEYREYYRKQIEVCKYLEENFSPLAWYQHGR